ncbi:MAG: hypothetical protein F4Z67_06440 [Synechococcus sp. SB0667_bin_8]|nr:hypothetical protein [Synechococcus sp. SB0667_bin_8]
MIVSLHQKAAGAKGAARASDGPLRQRADNDHGTGGGSGNLVVRSLLLPGQSHGSKGVAPLLSNLPLSALLSKPVRGMAAQRVAGAERPAGIPGKASRKEQRAWEGEACTWRHRIENCFAGSKEYGGVPPGMTTPPAALPATWHRVALPLPSRYTPLGHWQ